MSPFWLIPQMVQNGSHMSQLLDNTNTVLYFTKKNSLFVCIFAESEKTLKELIFLRDLHFGFLPDDCEEEFSACFSKIGSDDVFAWKCLRLALLSRNEDLISVLLNHLTVSR